jgi:hypothetical protein
MAIRRCFVREDLCWMHWQVEGDFFQLMEGSSTEVDDPSILDARGSFAESLACRLHFTSPVSSPASTSSTSSQAH